MNTGMLSLVMMQIVAFALSFALMSIAVYAIRTLVPKIVSVISPNAEVILLIVLVGMVVVAGWLLNTTPP